MYEEYSITPEIKLEKISFIFDNPIYKIITSYRTDWWGDRYATGSTKEYYFNEKISIISYYLKFSGDAIGKEGAIAAAIKSEIERRYNVVMDRRNEEYYILQDEKPSFNIQYSDKGIVILVGFNKLLLDNYSKYCNSNAYDEDATDYDY